MKRQSEGFYYSFSREKLAWWKAIPPEQKLAWLEEANLFLQKVMPEKNKKIMQAFRKGQTIQEANSEPEDNI
jgi:hypothetical protein